jgi:hypothetical protein
MAKKNATPSPDLFDQLTADDILGLLPPVKVRRNPNTKIILTESYFDFGRIGPIRISADGATWERLRKFIEEEPKEFLPDAMKTADAAATVNPILGRPKKETDRNKAKEIAPHLYVELKYWLKRKPMHSILSTSLAAQGINPASGGIGTPQGRVLFKMINAAYGTKYGMKKYRTFYKNYIQPRLGRVEAMHKKAGYPLNHSMFREVLFPKK